MIDFSNIKLPQDMTHAKRSNEEIAREIVESWYHDSPDVISRFDDLSILIEEFTAALEAKDARVPTVEEFARAAKAHIDKHYASTMLEYKSGFRDFMSGARWAIDRMNGEDK